MVYRVSSKALSIHNKTYIEDAAGNEVAYIHAKAISIHHRYYVEMVDGESFGLSEELFHVHDIVDIDAVSYTHLDVYKRQRGVWVEIASAF